MGQVRPRRTHFNVGGVDLILLMTVIPGLLTHTFPPSLLLSGCYSCQKSNIKLFTHHPYLSPGNIHALTQLPITRPLRGSQGLQGGQGLHVDGHHIVHWAGILCSSSLGSWICTRNLLSEKATLGWGEQSWFDKVERRSILVCPRFGHA